MVLGEGNLCLEKGFSLSQERGSLCLRMKDFFVSREREDLCLKGRWFFLSGGGISLSWEGNFIVSKGRDLFVQGEELSLDSGREKFQCLRRIISYMVCS